MGRNKRSRGRKQATAANPPAASQTAPAASQKAPGDKGEKKVRRFIVGLDFGTTYTSVAFAHSEATEIKMVETWPSGNTGNNSAKQVPTKLEYTETEITWGYEVQDGANDPGSKPLKWFKLLLQDRDAPSSASKNRVSPTAWPLEVEGRQSQLSEVNELFRGLGISPWVTPEKETRKIMGELGITRVKLVADFLKKIKETTLDVINRTYWMQSKVGTKVEWVLTVPAIWNDAAKNLMSQAAKQAGFGQKGVDFKFISEPECGATYALKAIQPNYLSTGDVFLLCDAGGGTVDLISYKITGITPLRVDMVVGGSGDLCGSVFLDLRFEDYILRTLGKKIFTSMKPRSKAVMMRSWEEVKFKFGNGTPFGTYFVSVHGVDNSKELNVEDGLHTMKCEDVQKIFDPVVDRIISLVAQQVSKVKDQGETVKAILLVGGFGSSEYLRKRLAEHIYGDSTINVLQPVNARTAIARGAFIRGLEGSIVETRCSPCYYGSASEACYAPMEISPVGADNHTYICPRRGVMMISDMMNWYMKKSMAIEPSSCSFQWVIRLVPGQQPTFEFSSTLYRCDLDEAPEYMWQKPTEVKPVCTLVADLSTIPRHKFRNFTNRYGLKYLTLDFEHRMTLEDEEWVFELTFEGTRYGVVKMEYKEEEEGAGVDGGW